MLSNGTLIVSPPPPCAIEDKESGGGRLLYALTASRQTCVQGCSRRLSPGTGRRAARLSLNHPLQQKRITYILRRCDTEGLQLRMELITFCSPVSKVDTVQIYHFLVKGLRSKPSRVPFFSLNPTSHQPPPPPHPAPPARPPPRPPTSFFNLYLEIL